MQPLEGMSEHAEDCAETLAFKFKKGHLKEICFHLSRSQLRLDPVHQISLVHHVRLSVPAVVSQQGNVLGCNRAHLHGAGN